MKRLHKIALLAALPLVSVSSFAQVDATDAVAQVTAVGVTLTAVGAAIIGLAAIALGIKWVKATFF